VQGGAHDPSDAFLHDIIEHPDDDTPWLIYADWPEEHGDGNRQLHDSAFVPREN
jgi:uncharacterized protein (TIGR02996 family)